MPGTHVESFCERCGTKYAFEQPVQRGRMLKGLGRTLGILAEVDTPETATAAASRDPFHGVFRFCLECRQYTCPNCWNETAGFCQGCVPLPESPDMGNAEAFAAVEAATHVRDALAEIRQLGTAEAWPGADLPVAEPEPEPVAIALPERQPEPEAPVLAAPVEAPDANENFEAAPVEEEPDAVDAMATADLEQTASETDREPDLGVADVPTPEVAAAASEPAKPTVVDADELFAGPWDQALALDEEPEAAEEWQALEPPAVAVAAPEPEPEPVVVAAPEPEPEPVVVAAPEPEPEPVVVAAPEPEPEPVVVAAPEPEPEPVMEPQPLPTPSAPPVWPVPSLPTAPVPAQPIGYPQYLASVEPAPSFPLAAAPALPSVAFPQPAPSAANAPGSRFGSLFGRGRKAPEPAPAHSHGEPPLANGWRVTAPDDTPVWPPQAPVYQPPAPQAPANNGRPSLLGPRPAAGPAASGIRPCYQCALPLSASARFCRRCGTPQQPGA